MQLVIPVVSELQGTHPHSPPATVSLANIVVAAAVIPVKPYGAYPTLQVTEAKALYFSVAVVVPAAPVNVAVVQPTAQSSN